MPPVVETIESETRHAPRNETSLGVDTRLVARLRRPPGGYELVRGIFGRSVSVRHKLDGRFGGFAIAAVGVAIVAWANIQEPDLMSIGRVLIIVGALTAFGAMLKAFSTMLKEFKTMLHERTGATHEAFLIGLERGRDESYEEGFLEGQKARPERPVLVDLADHIERNRAGV